ncbi:MAG: hypothetical protein WCO60_15560 [Verrucomicrobiota bacterium]
MNRSGSDALHRMEILAELLIGLLQVIVEVFCELILQLLVEMLVEIGLRSLCDRFDSFRSPRPKPWLSAFGYILLGAAAGALSIWVHPALFITSQVGRLANLIGTPIVVGLVMGAMGGWREKRGDTVLRIDRFACGFGFAVAMALVRFSFSRA